MVMFGFKCDLIRAIKIVSVGSFKHSYLVFKIYQKRWRWCYNCRRRGSAVRLFSLLRSSGRRRCTKKPFWSNISGKSDQISADREFVCLDAQVDRLKRCLQTVKDDILYFLFFGHFFIFLSVKNSTVQRCELWRVAVKKIPFKNRLSIFYLEVLRPVNCCVAARRPNGRKPGTRSECSGLEFPSFRHR